MSHLSTWWIILPASVQYRFIQFVFLLSFIAPLWYRKADCLTVIQTGNRNLLYYTLFTVLRVVRETCSEKPNQYNTRTRQKTDRFFEWCRPMRERGRTLQIIVYSTQTTLRDTLDTLAWEDRRLTFKWDKLYFNYYLIWMNFWMWNKIKL